MDGPALYIEHGAWPAAGSVSAGHINAPTQVTNCAMSDYEFGPPHIRPLRTRGAIGGSCHEQPIRDVV